MNRLFSGDLDNYLAPTEYSLDSVSFDCAGSHCTGDGVLKWHPEDGFQITAFVRRRDSSLPPGTTLGIGPGGTLFRENGFVRDSTIRMRGSKSQSSFKRAVTPNVALGLNRSFEVLHTNRLMARLARVIFFSQTIAKSDLEWSGIAIYRKDGSINWPDHVDQEFRVADQKIAANRSESGILCDSNIGHEVVGYEIDENHIEFRWKLAPMRWGKRHTWDWPTAAQCALSVLTGAGICLLQKTIHRSGRNITEVSFRHDSKPWGYYLRLVQTPTLDRNMFLRLTEFFLTGEEDAFVCRNILAQMEEASRQQTWQATELLVSTILEAALKTLDKRPFEPHDRSWKIVQSLDSFRSRCLSDQWTQTCERALEVRARLRHRNAHPDWLFKEGKRRSEPEKINVLQDISFLSQFYGYMILALAGFKDLKPNFL